jgi:hypothetical protein
MPPPALFIKNRATTAGVCVAYRYQGATVSQIGDTFGTRAFQASSNVSANRHGLVQFQGNLYARALLGVYMKDDPTTLTGTWTLVHTFLNPDPTTARIFGLHVVPVSGVPTLCAVYKGSVSANQYSWAKFDGTTWTTAIGPSVAGANTDFYNVVDETVYRGVIHMIIAASASTAALTFDPAAETFSAPAEPFTHPCVSMCVFNDRLLSVYLTTGERSKLAEYTGGAWSEVLGSETTWQSINSGHNSAKLTLFTDGTFLYSMGPSPTTDGQRCIQWDNLLGTPVDITDPVLPLSLRSSTDGGTYPGLRISARWAMVQDQDTDPAVATLYLYQSQIATGPWTVWQWNGPGAVLTQIDSGGDVTAAVPSGHVPGGERIWTPGEMDIWITGVAPVVGGERVYFSCSGDPGVANKKVSFRHNDQGEPQLVLGTLNGVGVFSGAPAGAPSLGTNEVLNVDADPTVVYYADWILTSDGFASGDRAQLKPVISV